MFLGSNVHVSSPGFSLCLTDKCHWNGIMVGTARDWLNFVFFSFSWAHSYTTFSRLPYKRVWPFNWIIANGMWVDVAHRNILYTLLHLFLPSKWCNREKLWGHHGNNVLKKARQLPAEVPCWNHGIERRTVTWARNKGMLCWAIEILKLVFYSS